MYKNNTYAPTFCIRSLNCRHWHSFSTDLTTFNEHNAITVLTKYHISYKLFITREKKKKASKSRERRRCKKSEKEQKTRND